MGKRGPKREPTNLKVLKGNPGHQKLNDAEPKPVPVAPSCPDWLDDEARQVWQMNAPALERLGLLTETDGNTYAQYCQAYARVIQAERCVSEYINTHNKLTYTYTNKNGAENEVLIPEIAAAKTYHAIAARLAASFGMEPSSRGQMRIKDNSNAQDKMEALLR